MGRIFIVPPKKRKHYLQKSLNRFHKT